MPMTDPAHSARLGLYHLFGDANAPHALRTLTSRCSISTKISAQNGADADKHADLDFISTHYSDQVAALCAPHETYRMAGYSIATLPYDNAESLQRRVSHHSHSFTPSAINETIKNLLCDHYRVMLPINAPDIFRRAVNDINGHYLKGTEKIETGTMMGRNYAILPAPAFLRLTREWQHDKLRAIAPSHIAQLEDPRYFAQPAPAQHTHAPRAAKTPDSGILSFSEERRTTPKRTIHEGERTGTVIALSSVKRG